jgi:FAD/FMN-containing dehydrogenase
VVLYFNVGTSDADQAEVQRWTRHLVDEALEKGGTYYLPYVPYASREQMRQAYPQADLFFAKKQEYDPELLFMSHFYETYS